MKSVAAPSADPSATPAAATREDLLVEAVQEYQAALDAGTPPDRQSFLARYESVAADLADCLDNLDFLRNIAPQLHDARRGSPDPAETADRRSPDIPIAGQQLSANGPRLQATLGDFRILRELGRGGMGIVYEAEQLSLGRRVALKVLPFASMLNENQLQRFKNEARAAATLKHPNIVSVYSVGVKRGVHYYAMELIEGASLAEVIASLRRDLECGNTSPLSLSNRVNRSDAAGAHEPPPFASKANPQESASTSHSIAWENESGDRSPHSKDTQPLAALSTAYSANPKQYFRRVAELGIQAASALQHAHASGILHRDIKPANLLLDREGQLFVTDFGLARIEAESRLSVTGDLVGTLRYMPPEQITGGGVPAPRGDIYSLGATLYEAAVLRPVFDEPNREALLKQITTAEPRRPRALNPAIPPELETILLKTLEREPADRYASAAALALDLRRFLNCEPIHAKPPTRLARLVKWVSRHRAVAWSAAVSLLVGVILLTTSTLLIARAYRSERAHRAEAEQRSKLARDRARLARQAVDRMYENVSVHWFSGEKDLTPRERETVEEALQIYQGLAREAARDEAARSERAEILMQVADIHYRLSQPEEAAATYRNVIELYREAIAGAPQNPSYPAKLATAYNNLSMLLLDEGRIDEQQEVLAQAGDLLMELARSSPDRPEYRHRLAINELNRATGLKAGGRLLEAERYARRASTSSRWLVETRPDYLPWRHHYAASTAFLATVLTELGRGEEAVGVCEGAVEACQALRLSLPEDREIQRLAALATGDLGEAHLAAGQLEEAEAHMQDALAQWEPLLFPVDQLVPTDLDEYASRAIRLGIVLRRTGKPEQAEEQLRTGIKFAEALVKDHPQTLQFQLTRATGYQELALLLSERKHEETDATFERAIEFRRALVREFPGHGGHLAQLGATLNNLANWRRGQGDLAGSRALLEEAVEHQRSARAAAPDHPLYREYLWNHHWGLVGTLIELSDHAAVAVAAEAFVQDMPDAALAAARALAQCMMLARSDSRLDEAQRLTAMDGYAARARVLLVEAERAARGDAAQRNDLAWFLVTAEQLELRDPERAIQLASRAIDEDPDNADYRNTLGVARYRAGRWQDAIAALEKSTELRSSGGDATDFFFLAMAHWQLGEKKQAQNWLDQAVTWMDEHKPDDEELATFRKEAEELMRSEDSIK